MSLLYLTREEVARLLPDVPAQLDLVEETYRAVGSGRVELPPKPGIHPRPDSFIHAMPAYLRDDDVAALKWVAANGPRLGLDTARLAVGGDSAGGNLAAVMALLARDRRGPRILLQLLIYPVTNYDFGTRSYAENATGYVLTTEDMRWFWRHYLRREEQGQEVTASPLRARSLADLPPALVMTAGCDPLRDEGDAYAARLRDAGVPVTLTPYPGMFHGFVRMTRILDQARAALDEMATALRKALA